MVFFSPFMIILSYPLGWGNIHRAIHLTYIKLKIMKIYNCSFSYVIFVFVDDLNSVGVLCLIFFSWSVSFKFSSLMPRTLLKYSCKIFTVTLVYSIFKSCNDFFFLLKN